MLEGVVHQLLLGYLGRYVKDFSKDQVKVTLWSVEVELSNIELILEAFDYLQLPFALRQGRVGKLRIKIPWKTIGGGEPILIALEDVFFHVSMWDDAEWTSDAVDKRDLAGKKAKLAAAELAKLSTRVCDNGGGWSFISYITAKVLENIQVFIRNFHIQFCDMKSDLEQLGFGLRFSSLTISKQNPAGLRKGQVSKTIEILAFEIYCGSKLVTSNSVSVNDAEDHISECHSRFSFDKFEYLLKPLTMSVSVVVNRAERLSNDLPQYSISSKLPAFVVSFNEVQLRHILILSDYLRTSQLREKYGRYRPKDSFSLKKGDSWQRRWWLYAQNSVLSDVRKKLKKTSWRCFGERLNNRRKYVNLYKIKLEFLLQDQPIHESIFQELEKMEKDHDADDILSYRSAAESEMQDILSNSSKPKMSAAKSSKETPSSSKSRGWLNWLSRGMLGAGGTDDFSQFSGVVTDEDIQDMYEATNFDPHALLADKSDSKNKISTFAIEFSVDRISVTLYRIKTGQEIAEFNLHGAVIRCKLCDDLTTVLASLSSAEIVYPYDNKVILLLSESYVDKNGKADKPVYRVQVDLSPTQVELPVHVMLESVQICCEPAFFLDLLEFLSVHHSFESQHERVLSSLNGIKDAKCRLLAKAEYIQSSNKKLTWDVTVSNMMINIPFGHAVQEQSTMVLEFGFHLLTLKPDLGHLGSSASRCLILENLLQALLTSDLLVDFQVQYLYDYFELNVFDFELKLMMPCNPRRTNVFEKFSGSVTYACCMIPYESILKQLEVYICLSSVKVLFSSTIYESLVAMVAHLNITSSRYESIVSKNPTPYTLSGQPVTSFSNFSFTASLESASLLLDLANNRDNSSVVMLTLRELDIRYSHQEVDECWMCSKGLEINFHHSRDDGHALVLCSCQNFDASSPTQHHDLGFEFDNVSDRDGDKGESAEGCFILRYKCFRDGCFSRHWCTVCLNHADVHVYPSIVGLLLVFYNRITSRSSYLADEAPSSPVFRDKFEKPVPGFEFEKFGFSNFSETGNSDDTGIPLDCFPFVSIHNLGSLSSVESSLRYRVSDWRKFFNMSDGKIRCPRSNLRKRSEVFSSPSLKPTSSEGVVLSTQISDVSNLYHVDIDLFGVRVHFHDSSSTVATITLPSSKSSLCMYHEFLDLVSSAEGLILESSFWTKNIHDFMCGPTLPNISPVLNIRLRKGTFGSFLNELEVSIGFQHMCCTLPPEFLAIIIGYFSLLDWTSGSVFHHVMDKEEYISRKDEVSIVYKFEVLDSTIIFPVDGDDNQFLMLEIRQLYCSFIEKCASSDLFKDIPPRCMVPEHKVSKPSHCLNIFGNDLSLLCLLFNDAKCGSLTDDSSSKMRKICLISPCNVEVWVRIPCQSELSGTFSESTCFMSRISTCQLIVDDGYCCAGFYAVLQLIDQFSSVNDQSKCFNSDILTFQQRKRCLKYGEPAIPKTSAITSTEIRLCVHSLSIQACRCRKDAVVLEPIAKADAKFVCSASLENDVLIGMDISFYHILLLSLLNDTLLAECSHSGLASVLNVSLRRKDQCKTELHVYLPSIDIWLYFFDWIELIHLLESYGWNTFETVRSDSNISGGDTLDQVYDLKPIVSQSSVKAPGISSDPVSENMNEANSMVIIISENFGFRVHFPLCVVEKAPAQVSTDVRDYGSKNGTCAAVKRECSKHFTVAAFSRSCEAFITHEYVGFKCLLDTTTGSLIPCGDRSSKSWPFFHIYQVNMEGEMCNTGERDKKISLKVNCDRVDVWVSNKTFVLWNEMRAGIPKSPPPRYAYRHFEVEFQLRNGSFLLSDERWSCSGPLFEIFLRNVLVHASMTEDSFGSLVTCDLEVNYNNIQKVFWESFLEPWKFQMRLSRKLGLNALINSATATEVHLTSTAQLNFNITEPLMETVFRTIDMVKDALDLMEKDLPGNVKSVNSQLLEIISEGRYAPYVLQNLTSLSLVYHVHQGFVDADLVDLSEIKDRKTVSPGASVPIYFNETLEDQLCLFRPSLSLDNLTDNQRNGVAHHFVTIQLDGTSMPSSPLSMDLVGVTCFEVDLSNASNDNGDDTNAESKGCVVPVVFDVSTQRYSKLMRLYSTVVFLNDSSMALELRFDIPFGISPKILDPVHPGQELPLPLHLAEAGRIRWRPLGNCYLWSEAHNISDILVQESKIGFLRSFVCYPSHPSSDPFRCCLSVQQVCLPAAGKSEKASTEKSKNHFLYQVTLSTPFIVNNYLPEEVSLTVESGGITCTVVLSEVVTFFHHIDHSHDLIITFNISGFRPSMLKFPRTEAFSLMAKFSGTKFSQSETLTFETDIGHGAINVTVEKTMDAFSGAREVFLSVPFLLYNCTAFPLIVSDCSNGMKGTVCTVPSYYDQLDWEPQQSKMDGLGLLISEQSLCFASPESGSLNYTFSKDSTVSSIVSSRTDVSPCFGRLSPKPLASFSSNHPYENKKTSDNNLSNRVSSGAQSVPRDNCIGDKEYGKVRACIFSPNLISAGSETMVCISICLAGFTSENMPKSSWSSPFSLIPPSGSMNVLLPNLRSNAASIISVTSTALAGVFAGRTRAITFQPRYVISNACSKDILFKQKGTDFAFHLGIGQHCQLQWTDTTRDLLVSLCFEEPGWQWSGSFSPDHLGDTLVKMRNYVSGASNMLRVEVQNSDLLVKDDKNAGSLQANSGTNLIILSDDHSGYMPYRIDNFSKEKLRLYQQKCESLDTIIYPYTSSSYAWDEPSYPHRLTVEVPGERILGSYALDELKEFIPVCLQSTPEKPERTLLLSVRAEGAKKVFSIIDSSYHIWNDVKDISTGRSQVEQKCDTSVNYTNRVSVALPSIGFSFIDSSPQELIFACVKNFTLYLHQNVEQQKLCFQISSLQIDNQLSSTHYPVLLSFTSNNKNNPVVQIMTDDEAIYKSKRPVQLASDISSEPVLYLAVSKWTRKDDALVSFEYINLRIADFCLQLEQESILSLLYFFKPIFQNFKSLVSPKSDAANVGPVHACTTWHLKPKEELHGLDLPYVNRTDGSPVTLPSVVPIGAPWQKIHLLARRQRKIYVESLDLAQITFTLSFSSSPWMLKNGVLTSGESLIHRGFMAFANVEGAQIYLKPFTIEHQMASWESIQEILIRHYVRQFLHESYKVFGSAGVIGNPMGFARSLGVGIRDFLSAPAKNLFQSPTGIITGIGKGTTSLVTSTVYALSDAATQFSKAAHKGIVAFTFDDLATARMEKQQKGSKGVINEVFEGLTGLLQAPVKEAEKRGLPGILSGVALGVTGLVAKPAASILEATGRTAQSIRNRSRLYHLRSQRYRLRLPRPLSRELPLRPYSWEEAVGASVLKEGDEGMKLKDEVFVMCKALKQPGKFVILTERVIFIVSCSSLVDLGKPEFIGIALDPEWTIETEISLHSVIHMDVDNEMVHIVGSSSDALLRKKQNLLKKGSAVRKQWNPSTPLPISQTNLELASEIDAQEFLLVVSSKLDEGKQSGWGGGLILHQRNVRY